MPEPCNFRNKSIAWWVLPKTNPSLVVAEDKTWVEEIVQYHSGNMPTKVSLYHKWSGAPIEELFQSVFLSLGAYLVWCAPFACLTHYIRGQIWEIRKEELLMDLWRMGLSQRNERARTDDRCSWKFVAVGPCSLVLDLAQDWARICYHCQDLQDEWISRLEDDLNRVRGPLLRSLEEKWWNPRRRPRRSCINHPESRIDCRWSHYRNSNSKDEGFLDAMVFYDGKNGIYGFTKNEVAVHASPPHFLQFVSHPCPRIRPRLRIA